MSESSIYLFYIHVFFYLFKVTVLYGTDRKKRNHKFGAVVILDEESVVYHHHRHMRHIDIDIDEYIDRVVTDRSYFFELKKGRKKKRKESQQKFVFILSSS